MKRFAHDRRLRPPWSGRAGLICSRDGWYRSRYGRIRFSPFVPRRALVLA